MSKKNRKERRESRRSQHVGGGNTIGERCPELRKESLKQRDMEKLWADLDRFTHSGGKPEKWYRGK